MPKNPCDVRIARKRVTKKGQPELVLFIRGHQVAASQKQTALLACLHKNHGHIVPYEQLIQVLGHKYIGRPQLHILRQYVLSVSKILVAHKSLGMIASVPRIGYALREHAIGHGWHSLLATSNWSQKARSIS
jgi:DNA-binding winged helix-turn-helix (wHTH) protein